MHDSDASPPREREALSIERGRASPLSRHRPRKRAIQYSEALVMEPKSRGVPDTPHARRMRGV